jgi:hypothetical protein
MASEPDRSTPTWRLFEGLVTRIETVLKPRGATVKSPDWIIDRVTGELREVDASIRYDTKGVPVLISVECRDRAKVQDVTWIEQLVTKRTDIGATQTIAVTSSQFTEPALCKARQYGIEVRKIEEISAEVIAQWAAEIEHLPWSIVSFGIDAEPPLPNGYQVDAFFRKPDDVCVPVQDLVNALLADKSAIVDGKEKRSIGDTIKLDEPERQITLQLSDQEPLFYVRAAHGRSEIRRIELVLKIQRQRVKVPFSAGARYISHQDPQKAMLLEVAEGALRIGKAGLVIQWERRQPRPDPGQAVDEQGERRTS